MKSSKKTVQCWGTPNYSTWEISHALTNLNVSHTLRMTSVEPHARNDLGFPQPRDVHVTNKVSDLKEGSVNFISASFADLGHTNIPRFPEMGQFELQVALKMMLESTQPETLLRVNALSALEYVAMVSKPSLLNNVQTLIYKIQPYSLRKETQAMILRYFNGLVSRTAIVYFLRKSIKTAELIPLINEGDDLREAVVRAKTEDVESVSQETGIAAFDLTYLGKERVVKAPAPKKPVKGVEKSIPNSMRHAIKADRKVVKF